MKKNLPLKITAVLTAISLMTDPGNLYAATGVPKPLPQASPAFTIPETLGQTEASFEGTSGKTILYIQDAHDSLEAQKNIASLISKFTEEDGIKTVFEEGYEGPVPTEKFFGFIQEASAREKVSGFLLDKLRIGGAEYAHINRKTDFKLIGADSLDKYKKNIASFRLAVKENDAIAQDLDTILTEIESLASQRFPKPLKDWLKIRDKQDARQIDLLDYLKRGMKLLQTSPSGLSDAAAAIPGIDLLLRAEASKDETLADQAKALAPQTLFAEISQLDLLIAQQFLANENDRRIFHYREAFRLLKRLSQMEVTPAEYAASKKIIAALNTRELADFIARESKKSLVLSKAWETHIQKASEFYEFAEQRDDAIEKTLADFLRSQDEKTAVLVYGGFHKGSIESILQKLGISCRIISPRISGPDPVHEAYYKELMSVGVHDYEKPILPGSGLAPGATRPPSLFVETFGEASIQALYRTVEQNPDTPVELLERKVPRSELRMVSSYDMEQAFGDLAKTPTLSGGRNEDFLYENGKKVAVIMPWSKFIYRALGSDGREIPDRIYKITHYASDNESLFEEAKRIYRLQKPEDVPGVSKLQRIGTLKNGGMWMELKGIASARSMDREIFGRTPRLFDVLIRAGGLLKGIHEHGIIHGDIKPENLLINSAQELEWIDFGGNFTRGYVALDEEKNPIEDKTSPDVDIYSFIMIIAHLLDHQIQAQSPEAATTLRRMRDEYLHLILKDWTFQRFEELLQIGVWTDKLTPLPRKKWPKDMSVITEKLTQDLQELKQKHPEMFKTAFDEEKKLIHASVHSSESKDTAGKLKELLDTLAREGVLHPGKMAVTDLRRSAVAPAFEEQIKAFSGQKEINIVLEGAYLDDCCRQASWTLLDYARNNPEKNLNLHFPVDLIAYPHDFLGESDPKEKINTLLFNLESDASGLSHEVFVDGVKQLPQEDAPAQPQEPVRVKLYLWSDARILAQSVTEEIRSELRTEGSGTETSPAGSRTLSLPENAKILISGFDRRTSVLAEVRSIQKSAGREVSGRMKAPRPEVEIRISAPPEIVILRDNEWLGFLEEYENRSQDVGLFGHWNWPALGALRDKLLAQTFGRRFMSWHAWLPENGKIHLFGIASQKHIELEVAAIDRSNKTADLTVRPDSRLRSWPYFSVDKVYQSAAGQLETVRSELRANADDPALLETYPQLKQISDAWDEFLKTSEVDRNKFLNAYEGGAFVRSPFQWMNYMKENWNLNSKSRILDVGSGNGLAAMAFNILTGAQVTSIEIDPMRWVVLQRFLTFLKDQKGLEFRDVHFEQGDFLKYPLDGVDLIYFYYTHPVTHQARQGDAIVDRLENDLPEGAVFVSPGFYLEAEYGRMLLRRINREAYFAETSLNYREALLPPGRSLEHTRTAVVLTKRMDGAVPESPPRSELRAAEIPAELAGFNSSAPLWDFLTAFGIDPAKAKIETLKDSWGRVRIAQNQVFGIPPGEELNHAVMESAFAIFDARETRERLLKNGHPEDSALRYLYLLTYEKKPAAFVWAIPGEAFEPIFYYPLMDREQQALWSSSQDKGSSSASLNQPLDLETFIRSIHKEDYGKNSILQGGLPLSTLRHGLPGARVRTFEEGIAFPTVFSLNHASSKGLVAAADLLTEKRILKVEGKIVSEIGSGAGWIGTQMALRGAKEAHLYDLSLIKAANAMETAKDAGVVSRVHAYRSRSADVLPPSDLYLWNIPDFSSAGKDLSGTAPLDQTASIDVNNRIRIESVQKVFQELLSTAPVTASFLVRINPLDEPVFRDMLKKSGWEIHPQSEIIQTPGRGGSYFLLRPELQGDAAKARQDEDKLPPGLRNNPELFEAFREIGRELRPQGNQLPVLLIEGMPGSGKSSRAQDLKAVLESEGRRAVVIHSQSYLRNGRYNKPLSGFFGLLLRWLGRRPARELLTYAANTFVNGSTVASWIQQIHEIQKKPEGSGFLKINTNPRDDIYIGPETVLIIEGTLSSVLFASVPNIKKLFLDLSGSKIRSQFIRRALRETSRGPVYAFFKAWLMVPEIAVRFFRMLSRNFDFVLNLTDENNPILTRPHKIFEQPRPSASRSELRTDQDRALPSSLSAIDLTVEEKEMIRQTQRTGLFRAGPHDETKPLWLFGEQDVTGPFIAGHLGSSEIPVINPDFYAGKKVLVAPGYGNLPFLLRAFGAREVTAMDLDPATIAWQKLKWKSGTEDLQNWLFVTETSRPMVRSYLQSGWVSHLNDPPADDAMDHLTFQAGNLLDPIPLSGEKYDLVVIPYLFGFAHGLVTEDQWDKVLENLGKVLTPEGRIILVPGKMDLSKFRESDEKNQTENYQIWLNDLERKGWKASHSKRYGFHNILGYEPVSAGFSILTPRSELRGVPSAGEIDSFFQKVRDVFAHLPGDFKHRNELGYEFKTQQEVSEHLGGLGNEVSAAVSEIYQHRGFMMGSESIEPQDNGKPVHSRTFWIDPSNPNFRFGALLEIIKRGTEAVEGIYDQRDTEAAVDLLQQQLGGAGKAAAPTMGLAALSSWLGLLDQAVVLDLRLSSRSELRAKTQVEIDFDQPIEIPGLAELIAKAPTIQELAKDPARKIRRFPDGTYGNLYSAPFGHDKQLKILWESGDLQLSYRVFDDTDQAFIYFTATKMGVLFSFQTTSGKITGAYAYDPSRISPFIFSKQAEGMPLKEEALSWFQLKPPGDEAIRKAFADVETQKVNVWENFSTQMALDNLEADPDGKTPQMLAENEEALTNRILEMHHAIFWEQDLFQFRDGTWGFLDGKSGMVPNLTQEFRDKTHISIHNHPMLAPEEESGVSRGDQGAFLKESSLKAEYVVVDYGGAYKMTMAPGAPDPALGEKTFEGLQGHVTLTGVSRAWVHDTESGRWIKVEYLPENVFQKLFAENGLKIFTDVVLDWKSLGEGAIFRSELRSPEQPERNKEKTALPPDELQLMRTSLRHFLRRQLEERAQAIDPSKYIFITDTLPYRILAARDSSGKILGFAFGKKGNRHMHSLITQEGHEPSGFLHEKDEHGVRIITYVTEGDKNYKEDEFILGRFGDVYRLKIIESGGTSSQQAIEYHNWMPSYMLTKAQEVEALSKILGPKLYAGIRQFLPAGTKLVLAPGMDPESRMTFWPSVQGSIRSREEVFGGLDHEGFDIAHIRSGDGNQQQLKEGTPIRSLVNERGNIQWVFEDNVQSTAIVLSDLVLPVGSKRMYAPKNPDDMGKIQIGSDGSIQFPEGVEYEVIDTPGEKYRVAFVYTHLALADWVKPGAEIEAGDNRTIGTIEKHRRYPYSPVVPHLHFAVMLFKESEIAKYPHLNYEILNRKLGPEKTILYVNPLSLLETGQRTDLFIEGDAAQPGFKSAAIQTLDANSLKSVRARLAHTLLGIPIWTAASPGRLTETMQQSDLVIHQTPSGWEILLSGPIKDKLLHLGTSAKTEEELLQRIEEMDLQLRHPIIDAYNLSMKETKTMSPEETVQAIRDMAQRKAVKDPHDSVFIDVTSPDSALVNIGYGVHANLISPPDNGGIHTDSKVFFFRLHYRPERIVSGQNIPEYLVIKPPYLLENPAAQTAEIYSFPGMDAALYLDLITLARFLLRGGFPGVTKIRMDEFDNFPNILKELAPHEENGMIALEKLSALSTELPRSELRAAGGAPETLDQKESLLPSLWADARSAFGKRVFSYEEFTAKAFPLTKAVFRSQFELLETLGLARVERAEGVSGRPLRVRLTRVENKWQPDKKRIHEKELDFLLGEYGRPGDEEILRPQIARVLSGERLFKLPAQAESYEKQEIEMSRDDYFFPGLVITFRTLKNYFGKEYVKAAAMAELLSKNEDKGRALRKMAEDLEKLGVIETSRKGDTGSLWVRLRQGIDSIKAAKIEQVLLESSKTKGDPSLSFKIRNILEDRAAPVDQHKSAVTTPPAKVLGQWKLTLPTLVRAVEEEEIEQKNQGIQQPSVRLNQVAKRLGVDITAFHQSILQNTVDLRRLGIQGLALGLPVDSSRIPEPGKKKPLDQKKARPVFEGMIRSAVERLRGTDPEFAEVPIRTSLLAYELGLSDTGLRDPLKELGLLPLLEELGVFSFKPSTPALESQTRKFLRSLSLQDTQELIDFTIGKSGARRKTSSKDPSVETVQRVLDKWINEQDIRRKQRRRDYVEALQRQAVKDYEAALAASAGLDEKKKALRALFPAHPALLEEAGLDPAAQKTQAEYLIPADIRRDFEGYLRDFRSGFLGELGVLKLHAKINFQVLIAAVEMRDRTAADDEIKAERYTGFGVSSFEGVLRKAKKAQTLESFWSAWDLADQYPPLGGEIVSMLKTLDRFYGNRSELRTSDEGVLKNTLRKNTNLMLWHQALGTYEPEDPKEKTVVTVQISRGIQLKFPMPRFLLTDPEFKVPAYRYLASWIYNLSVVYGTAFAAAGVEGEPDLIDIPLLESLLKSGDLSSVRESLKKGPENPLGISNYANAGREITFKRLSELTEADKEVKPVVMDISLQTNVPGAYLGVDVGGGSAKWAVIKDGQILELPEELKSTTTLLLSASNTPLKETASAYVARMTGHAQKILAYVRQTYGIEKLDGVGIDIPGAADFENNRMVTLGQIPVKKEWNQEDVEWTGRQLPIQMAAALDLDPGHVKIRNDMDGVLPGVASVLAQAKEDFWKSTQGNFGFDWMGTGHGNQYAVGGVPMNAPTESGHMMFEFKKTGEAIFDTEAYTSIPSMLTYARELVIEKGITWHEISGDQLKPLADMAFYNGPDSIQLEKKKIALQVFSRFAEKYAANLALRYTLAQGTGYGNASDILLGGGIARGQTGAFLKDLTLEKLKAYGLENSIRITVIQDDDIRRAGLNPDDVGPVGSAYFIQSILGSRAELRSADDENFELKDAPGSTGDTEIDAASQRLFALMDGKIVSWIHPAGTAAGETERHGLITSSAREYFQWRTQPGQYPLHADLQFHLFPTEEEAREIPDLAKLHSIEEEFSKNAASFGGVYGHFFRDENGELVFIASVIQTGDNWKKLARSTKNRYDPRRGASQRPEGSRYSWYGALIASLEDTLREMGIRKMAVLSSDGVKEVREINGIKIEDPITEKMYGKPGPGYTLEQVTLKRLQETHSVRAWIKELRAEGARSELRLRDSSAEVLQKGTLLINAETLAGLDQPQTDELFSRLYMNKSGLRLVVFNENGQVPNTPAFNAILKLPNVFKTPGTDYDAAGEKYGFPNSASVLFLKQGELFQPKNKLLKGVLLKKRAGEIEFARLLVFNGGRLPNVSEDNGVFDPPADFLSDLDQKILSTLVVAYSA